MKTIRSNWKWMAVGLLIMTVLFAISWELIFSKTLETVLTHSFSNSERTLKIQHIYREKDHWVIDQPCLIQGDQTICSVPKATFKYAIDFWNGTIDLFLTLDEPEFNIQHQEKSFNFDANQPESSNSFFKWNTHLSIRKGFFQLKDQYYGIQGDLSISKAYGGHLHIDFKEGALSDNHLFLDFIHDPATSFQLDFQCQKVDCFHLHQLASYFFPDLNAFNISTGILDGTGGILTKRKSRPILYAEANLSQFRFEHIPTQLKGSLQEVRFHLQKNAAENSLSYGSIIFCGDETFTYTSQNSPDAEIRNMLGGIYVDDQARAKIVLHGIYDNFGQFYNLSLQGDATFPPEDHAFLNLDWNLEDTERKSTGHLKLQELAEKQYEMQLDLNQLRFQDTTALQELLHGLFPTLRETSLNEGVVDISAHAYFNQKKLSKITFEHIKLSDLKIHYLPWNSVWKVEQLFGQGNFSFSPEFIEEKTELRLNMQNGQVASMDDFWFIDDIQSYFNISHGILVDSYAKGHLGNIHVSMNYDVASDDTIKIGLNGNTQELFQYIPSSFWREKLNESFAQDQFVIAADLKHLEKNEEVIGLAKIINSKGEEKPLAFGFELSREESTNNIHEYLDAFKKVISSEAFTRFKREKPNVATKINGYHFRNGWFLADELPIEKYVAPFCIYEKSMHLNGVADFRGRFDQHGLFVTYDLDELGIENTAFKLNANPNKSKCMHYFDFDQGNHLGFLTLLNATYLEKNSGLLFTDINTDIIFEENAMHLPSLETFCQGLYMAGSLDVLFKKPGHFDVDICTQTVHGKLTQVQHFFSSIHKTLFFLKIPMEGDISMHQDAGHLHFAFSPETYEMQVHLKGALSDGMINVYDTNVALHELSLNFEYDYQANTLDFSEIQGTLLVGEPERMEEYTVVGEKIHFFDYSNNQSIFDLWVGDKKRDVIRVAGKTFSPNSQADEVQFLLDHHLSHFGNVHPEIFHLVLKDWWQVQEFRLMADFKLDNLFKDLQRFSRTGFLFLTRHALKQLNDIKKGEGVFKVDIAYDGLKGQLDYHIKGEDVLLDNYSFKNVSLDGKKIDETWMIDQLVLDHLSLAADILRKPGSWLINFMGLQAEKSLLMGLQGEYFDDSRIAEGKINLLEIDFASLKNWPAAVTFLKECPLKGNLKATGQFRYDGGENESKFDALLTASLKNLQFDDIRFDDIQHTSVHFASDRGVIVRQLKTALNLGENSKTHLQLEKFEYDFKQDAFSLENLHFLVAFSQVTDTLKQMEQFFPAISTFYMKSTKDLEGTLSFDYAKPHYGFKLLLKDGEYLFLNKKLNLSDFSLEYDPCEVRIITQCKGYLFPFWIQYKSLCDHLDQAEIQITEEFPGQRQENPLVVKCQNDAHEWKIQQVVGQWKGTTFNLLKDETKEESSQSHFLKGVVQFNAKEAISFLSPALGKNFEIWQIGDGYAMNGQWACQPAQFTNEIFNVQFKGQLIGQNFEFKGYRFQHLLANMQMNSELVLMQNVQVEDPSGILKIKDLNFQKQPNQRWSLKLSTAEAFEFKPSQLLRTGGEPSELQKPLVIRQLNLENVQGYLGYPESFIGTGSLVFVNAPKRNTHPLFAIPGEILTHLGLDLSVLNPVVGTIFYEIKEAKFYLTKLKDVYSQGKMSKFYLPNNSHDSYLDFDGNLNVQIKMKHYNLIFKLAELFTVTVQGTFQKPTYTLQKQKK